MCLSIEISYTASIIENEIIRPPRWCRDGNACRWSDCGFRHQTCTHFSIGKCRALRNDPQSNMCPKEGGCMYDHRDHLTLLIKPKDALPVTTDKKLFDSFYERGLMPYASNIYDVRDMSDEDYDLLVHSLNVAGSFYETWGGRVRIRISTRDG